MLKVTDQVITVEYEDGSLQSIEIGNRYGAAAGATYEHTVVTKLKEGQRFEPGTTIAYNEGFFSPDPLDSKSVLWKAGVMCRTAIMESSDTFEDSSVISERIADELSSKTVKIRQLFFDFDQTVSDLVRIGTKVDPETILCILEDAVTADNDVFDEETRETLRLLAGNSPKAKYHGVVSKMECLYYGDKEDMSDSIRSLADRFDKEMSKKRKAMGLKPIDCSVSDGIRIDNKTLEMDTLVLKIYITRDSRSLAGDKGVFGNQMKTIFARVMSGVNETESGTELDAIFSYASISNRLVLSPELMGTTNTLLRLISKRVSDVYFEDSK